MLISTLPFGMYLQVFVGYPLRLATAHLVSDLLAQTGIPSFHAETILSLENRLGHVDLPCSGVRSLWAGGLFLLGATSIQGHPINRRWFSIGLVFLCLLLGANLARVAAIASVGLAAGHPDLARVIHVPLGIFVFLVSCLTCLALMRRSCVTPECGADVKIDEAGEGLRPPACSPSWLLPGLCLIVGTMAFAHQPRPSEHETRIVFPFPPDWRLEEVSLDLDQEKWLTDEGADQILRYRFAKGSASGTLLMVLSRTWRAQHLPESCIQSQGFPIEDSAPFRLSPDFPIRWLTLEEGDRSACYWFQSPTRITDEYAARIWADLKAKKASWVMVSLLFEQRLDPLQDDTHALLSQVRQVVDKALKGAEP